MSLVDLMGTIIFVMLMSMILRQILGLQKIEKRVRPCIIKHGEALRLKASQGLVDKTGK